MRLQTPPVIRLKTITASSQAQRILGMSSNLRVNTSMDFEANGHEQDQKRQLLLAKLARIAAEKEELDAQLAELPPLQPSNWQSSYQHGRSPIQKQSQQRRGSNVPRSMSSTGTPAMTRPLIDRNDMSRALSSRSATSMARANSRGKPSQRPTVPFTQNGAIPPPLNSEPVQENSMIMDWASQEQPFTSYTFSHQNPHFQMSKPQRGGLQRVPEDPAAWIERTLGNVYSPSMSSPNSATINNNRLTTGSYIQPAPSTPTAESLTTATTLPSESDIMSRQNSLCNGVQSMQFTSNNFSSTDQYDDQSMFDYVPSFISSHLSLHPANEEQSQLLVGAGGASHESKFSPSFQFSSSDVLGGTKMEKSESTSSTSSSSSSSLRSHKRLQEHIAAGQARPILMPKAGSGCPSMSQENSSLLMARMESKDGLQDKSSVSKPSYKRPKHDRVFCKLCENHPDGFRGEHEHRRHVDREHKTMVKKWVCVEPTDGGKHPLPVVPLSRCKACSQQKKKYGAYYNAAAHLRRAHFNPKPKGRGKSQQKIDDADKRGAKSSGDEPEMTELKKYWMKEVEERVDYAIGAQQEAADDSEEELFNDTFDDQSYPPHNMSSITTNPFGGSIYNTSDNNNNNNNNDNNTSHYSSTTAANMNDNNSYGVIDISHTFSESQQQTYMPQVMYSLPVQNDFLSFPADIFQNELLGLPTTTFVPSQSFDSFGNWNN